MSDIYSAPGADLSLDGNDEESYTPAMFSLNGRIGRCRLLAYATGSMLLALAAVGMLFLLMSDSTRAVFVPLLLSVASMSVTAISLVFVIRRLNDLNLSGWLCLLSLVPVVHMLFGLYLMCVPGIQGRNSYGPAPEPNTGLIIAGALLLPAIPIVAIITAIVIFINALSSMRG